MLSQTIQIDETGKATTITTTVDRAQSLVTETVYPANPSQPSTRIIRNGVLQSEQFRPLHLEEPAIPGDSPAADKRISPTPPAFVSKPNPLAGPGAHENPYPMPFIGAQPSLTPEENNIFAQACIELQKDADIIELNTQIKALIHTRGTLTKEKLQQINPVAATSLQKLRDQEKRLIAERQAAKESVDPLKSAGVTIESPQPKPAVIEQPVLTPEENNILNQATLELKTDKDLLEINAQIKTLANKREKLIGEKLGKINPVAGACFEKLKEGLEEIASKRVHSD